MERLFLKLHVLFGDLNPRHRTISHTKLVNLLFHLFLVEILPYALPYSRLSTFKKGESRKFMESH